ncbi:MAG: nucleotidyltransferase domain-containing protein [Candidatus Bathyarchaeia archaeon]
MTEKGVHRVILDACSRVAGKDHIEAICLYGSRVSGYAREDSDYDVLLILSEYANGVKYSYEKVDDNQLALLIVDKKALELDAEKGSFGDFIAGRLISPYTPILNTEYLEDIEVKIKKRFAEEDLEDLVIEYEELARGLVIRLEYLVLARMRKRSRGYPPLRYSYINMLREGLRDKNMTAILKGYKRAVKELATSKFIRIEGEAIRFENEYVDIILSSKTYNKVVNLVDFSRRALSAYITHGKAGRVKLDVFAMELTSKIKRELQTTFKRQRIEDPKNFLFLKTDKGLMCLNEESTIVELVQKLRNEKNVDVNPLSSSLNEVYSITLDDEKLVVKKFTNWYTFKWFMLNIAAYGTKVFSLSGKARLANEYGINRLLAENNILVPEIVAISIKDRVLVERYIEGASALDFLEEAFSVEELTDQQKGLAIELGKIIATIHSLNVVIGDCKPENFIIGKNGQIYVLDLEQGERRGDPTWDVAEFLYFSGHFGSKFTNGLRDFVLNFVEGYCQIGDRTILRRAAGFRYSRVFLGWTHLPIIQAIASVLKAL